jgi:hypothetical protein
MNRWIQTAALATGLALTVGVPTLACSGMDMASGDLSTTMLGTYAVQPSPDTLRELKILKAAVSGKPPSKGLQPMSAADKEIYKTGKNAGASEKAAIKHQLNSMAGARVTFEGSGKGLYTFNGGENPFSWTTADTTATPAELTLTYDHGVVEIGTITLNGSDLDVHWKAPREMDLVFKSK